MQHATSAVKHDQATSHDSTKASATATQHLRKPAWTKDQIKEAQEGLAKAGYFKGKPTGVYDQPDPQRYPRVPEGEQVARYRAAEQRASDEAGNFMTQDLSSWAARRPVLPNTPLSRRGAFL